MYDTEFVTALCLLEWQVAEITKLCSLLNISYALQLKYTISVSDQFAHKSMAAAMQQAQEVAGIVQVMPFHEKNKGGFQSSFA